MARKRRRGRVALFIFLIIAAFVVFLFGRRLVHRPSTSKDNAAGGGGSSEGDSGGDEPGVIVEDHRRYVPKTWSFPLAKYDVTIEDTSMTTALDGTLAKVDAELVVNGGFFGADQKAVGLAMSKGAVLSRLSRQMSGGVLTIASLGEEGERAALFPAETFDLGDGGASFAIQCKPRLVVDSAPNIKSDDGKRAERTALCLRNGGRAIDVVIIRSSEDGESPGPSLFAFAHYLHRSGCEASLNLDGGPSTGVAWREEDGGVQLLPPRAPVRHVVAFREKR